MLSRTPGLPGPCISVARPSMFYGCFLIADADDWLIGVYTISVPMLRAGRSVYRRLPRTVRSLLFRLLKGGSCNVPSLSAPLTDIGQLSSCFLFSLSSVHSTR